jgi:hypothetical protein
VCPPSFVGATLVALLPLSFGRARPNGGSSVGARFIAPHEGAPAACPLCVGAPLVGALPEIRATARVAPTTDPGNYSLDADVDGVMTSKASLERQEPDVLSLLAQRKDQRKGLPRSWHPSTQFPSQRYSEYQWRTAIGRKQGSPALEIECWGRRTGGAGSKVFRAMAGTCRCHGNP